MSVAGRLYAYTSVRYPVAAGNDQHPVPDCSRCTVKIEPKQTSGDVRRRALRFQNDLGPIGNCAPDFVHLAIRHRHAPIGPIDRPMDTA